MSLHYELKRQEVTVGGKAGVPGPALTLVLELLADLDATIDALFAELERTGDGELLETLCPYFGKLWPSARALAEELAARRAELAGQRLLELGCGLALPSLVAARLGARPVATDFHPEVPVFLRRNCVANGIELEYHEVDWRAGAAPLLPEHGFDWVIGSDVLYERRHAVELARKVERFLAPGGRALLTDPGRPYLQGFVDEAGRVGLAHRVGARTVPEEAGAKEIFLIELWRD